MLRQVVAPHEPLLAEGAPKLFFACVGSVVPGELIGTRELFKAARPHAEEWSLTCREKRMPRNSGEGYKHQHIQTLLKQDSWEAG